MVTSIHLKQIVPQVLCYPAMESLAEVETVRSQQTNILDGRHDAMGHLLKIKRGQMLDCKHWVVEGWLIADSVES